MKQLKDYLHLYLGCDAIVNDNMLEILKLKTVLQYGEIYCCLKPHGEYIGKMGAFYPLGKIKPILRPLSSMTDEEQFELNQIEEALQFSGDVPYLNSYAAVTNQCRKWRIDIDGLIEAGLAIDATTINK